MYIILLLTCASCISIPVKKDNTVPPPPVISEITVPFTQETVTINQRPLYQQPIDAILYILIIVVLLGTLPHILSTIFHILEYVFMYIKRWYTK